MRDGASASKAQQTLIPCPAWQLALMGNVHLHPIQWKIVLFNWATLATVPALPGPMHSSKDDTEKEHMKHTECSSNASC